MFNFFYEYGTGKFVPEHNFITYPKLMTFCEDRGLTKLNVSKNEQSLNYDELGKSLVLFTIEFYHAHSEQCFI